MVPDISRGSRTYGLLAYLYGPGKRDEHTDPHQVASFDGFAPDPGRNPHATLTDLTRVLDLRVNQLGHRAPKEHVWHCSVRTAPGDRHLTDAEWGQIARRIVHATGIAEDGDPDGCRWVAVRHADDHIHIVATTVRGDLRQPRNSYDFTRSQAECRRIEKELGLRQLNPGDGTAAPNPTSAERFKAERTGRDRTPREILRETVRQAVAGAADETEFFTRLTQAGLRVNKRIAPSGDTLGYTVALPGDRNRDGQPIWFPGSKLAPDLSLPKIRKRLAAGPIDHNEEPDATSAPGPHRPPAQRSKPAQTRRRAALAAERATTALEEDDDEDAAAQLLGAGELLDALAATSAPHTRTHLREAARAFERATRSHIRAEHADNRAARAAARSILRAGGALGRGEDGATTAMVLSTLVLLAVAAARWHSARGHAQQAAASAQAAHHLRAAYRQAAAAPLATLIDHGRALPEPERGKHQATIRAALPDHLLPPGTDPNHEALTATLAQAERAGHHPETLLRQAIAMRELDTAEDIDGVLVWRLRRLAHLPAHPSGAPRRFQPSTSRSATPTLSTGIRPAPTTTGRAEPPDRHNRPPRR
ncbi:relaxase/mobilization nuclease domain-containing protein [Streptomyces sp. B1866]|uniref:relaxase/mobilization nuclease domain-containing protein n=1 Tax=Streptomyces sp. B1866 TaxID=3075431 RepID=UPI00288E2A87|nr:relaxase/mobilization nuclease domain-containing protein [Streptomyces sp. B1866]MDT3395286.1 relaxase/mobilization nuclease domain-containing protein [Streptomyces sp. B1866]